MNNKKSFKPEEIVDLNVDYYAILGIERGCLPPGSTRKDRQEVTSILKKAYRNQARTAHPDFGGTEEAFKMLVRAEYILEDPVLRKYYESGGTWRPSLSGAGSEFDVDWETLGTYRQGTEADTVGYGLFLEICQRAKDLKLVPAFRPSDSTHNYEWDWVIAPRAAEGSKPPKLVLSIVYDEGDVLRLTSGEDAVSDSLPFKIYICIPRDAIQYLRGEKQYVQLKNGKVDVFNGKLMAVAYSDIELLETTKLQEAKDYVASRLEQDIKDYIDGSLEERQKAIDKKRKATMSVDSKTMQDADREMLKVIMRGKMHKVEYDPHAADFLKDLPMD